jgi:hypothetical protein
MTLYNNGLLIQDTNKRTVLPNPQTNLNLKSNYCMHIVFFFSFFFPFQRRSW